MVARLSLDFEIQHQITVGGTARKFLSRSKEKVITELMGIDLPIVRQIREGTLSISQLPDELFDDVGRIRKPSSC